MKKLPEATAFMCSSCLRKHVDRVEAVLCCYEKKSFDHPSCLPVYQCVGCGSFYGAAHRARACEKSHEIKSSAGPVPVKPEPGPPMPADLKLSIKSSDIVRMIECINQMNYARPESIIFDGEKLPDSVIEFQRRNNLSVWNLMVYITVMKHDLEENGGLVPDDV